MKHLHLFSLRLNWSATLRRAVMAALLIMVAGCTFLAPIPEKSRFYLLTGIPPGENSAQAGQQNTSGLILGLGPVRFPDYLQRSEIAERVGSNQVQFLDNDHWAEPLKDNFTHVLSQNLSMLLGTQQIVNFPWYSSTHIDYQIAVTVDRFECGTQGQAELAARWSITDPVTAKVIQRRNSDLTASCAGNADPGVGALSQTLADLSRQIATALTQIAASHHPHQRTAS
jgi:uncharacterized lipoprotein YmbA